MTADRFVHLLENQKIRLTQYFNQIDPYECSIALLTIEKEKEQASKDDYLAERIWVDVSFKNKYFQLEYFA